MKNLTHLLKAEDTAPEFELKNQDDQLISLKTVLQSGKALVYFYPKAMTPGCTVQAQSLRDHKDAFDDLNLTILGISPDPVKRLTKFAQRDGLNFHLLSDEDHQIADKFGVWGLKKFMGKEYDGIHRLSFLINQQGKVEHVFTKFKTKDHHQVVLDYLTSN